MADKPRIGWIGTGVMGHSMAGHLIEAGYSLTVFNRTPSKCQSLVEKGAAYYCFCDKERLASLKTEVVDGKEMTSDQKKKYRQKMRTLLKTMSKEKAEAEGKKYAAELASGAPAAAPKKEESAKEKKADKPSKEGKDKKKKKKKKTKKTKKEED